MMFYKIKYLLFIFVLLGFFSGISFGYFEDKYFCSINGNSIKVSLKNKDNSYKRCMSRLDDIQKSIKTIDEKLETINLYIKNKDNKKYWLNIKDEVENKKRSLISFKSSIYNSMKNFESRLFDDIKKVLDYKLKKTKNNLRIRYENLENMKENSIKNADEKGLKSFRKQFNKVHYKLTLINSMLKAKDFKSLIPLLKAYLK